MEKNKIFKILFVVFLITTIGLGSFLIYDKLIAKDNDEETNTSSCDKEQNTKNDISKLKEILKEQAFGNFDQSVESYFEGYLGPIVQIMVKKNTTSVENLPVEKLSEEDIAQIICLEPVYSRIAITNYFTEEEKLIRTAEDVSLAMKKYFNINDYKFSYFEEWKEDSSKWHIYKNSENGLTCENISVGFKIEVTDVIYDSSNQKILVYIEAINPGQMGAPNIDFSGSVELKYNGNNFNVINVNFKEVLDA